MLANERTRRYARGMAICYMQSPVGRLALEAEDDEGGYSGGQGLKTKHKLLALEGVVLSK
jgi:hypothetical protein